MFEANSEMRAMKATQLLSNGTHLKSNNLRPCHQEQRCTRLSDPREAGEGQSPPKELQKKFGLAPEHVTTIGKELLGRK